METSKKKKITVRWAFALAGARAQGRWKAPLVVACELRQPVCLEAGPRGKGNCRIKRQCLKRLLEERD